MNGSKLYRDVFLRPGEMVVAEEPTVATTVLGSCVSITFYHPKFKIGSICHAVLPVGDNDEPGKYVDQAVDYMLNRFSSLNIRPKELVAKLFGGADMFHKSDPSIRNKTVGAQNISEAIKCIQGAGLKISASDTGGELGRKLIFYTHTGEVFIKLVKKEPLKLYEL